MTTNIWKIKKGQKQLARKINFITAVLSVLIGIAAFSLLHIDGWEYLMVVAGSYVMLAYIGLGCLNCYICRRFKGHIALRWIVLIFVVLYTVLYWVFFFIDYPPDGALIPWPFEILILLCSIQCVRNGYV